jgi:hypothetical protein
MLGRGQGVGAWAEARVGLHIALHTDGLNFGWTPFRLTRASSTRGLFCNVEKELQLHNLPTKLWLMVNLSSQPSVVKK